VRIEADVQDDIPIVADVAVAVGLIVNELVTNALKHAFPEPARGTVRVRAARSGAGRVVMSVVDNGVGMEVGRKGNLGFGIVRSLVRQIGGKMVAEGVGGVSTTVSFSA
jgi:two-component sensor histidine kinase